MLFTGGGFKKPLDTPGRASSVQYLRSSEQTLCVDLVTVNSMEEGRGAVEKFEMLYVLGTSIGTKWGNQERSSEENLSLQAFSETSHRAAINKSPKEAWTGHISD
jgi:hypothetical protein